MSLSREEKNKQEYGLRLFVDTKFQEDSELLLTVKLDESGQTSHINHINASSMEKPLLGRPMHGVMAPTDYKQRTGQHQSALLPPRAPATVALHRTSVAAGDWTKKHTQGTKRKLDFEGCDDPRNFKPQGEPNKKKKQESIKSSDSFSYVSKSKVEVAKQTHLDS